MPVAPFPFTATPEPVPRHPVIRLAWCDRDLLDDYWWHRPHCALIPMTGLPDPLVVLPCPMALHPSVIRARLCRAYFLDRWGCVANDRGCLASDNRFPDHGRAATGEDQGATKCKQRYRAIHLFSIHEKGIGQSQPLCKVDTEDETGLQVAGQVYKWRITCRSAC